MTIEDYDTERERILSDGRYSSERQMYLIFQLLETFKKTNGCLPHEMYEENSWCHHTHR